LISLASSGGDGKVSEEKMSEWGECPRGEVFERKNIRGRKYPMGEFPMEGMSEGECRRRISERKMLEGKFPRGMSEKRNCLRGECPTVRKCPRRKCPRGTSSGNSRIPRTVPEFGREC